MKIIFLKILILFTLLLNAQKKEDIEVDKLTKLIEKKQKEVALKILNNYVVKKFEKNNDIKTDNYYGATYYYYLYQILESMINENKVEKSGFNILKNLAELILIEKITNTIFPKKNNKNAYFRYLIGNEEFYKKFKPLKKEYAKNKNGSVLKEIETLFNKDTIIFNKELLNVEFDSNNTNIDRFSAYIKKILLDITFKKLFKINHISPTIELSEIKLQNYLEKEILNKNNNNFLIYIILLDSFKTIHNYKVDSFYNKEQYTILYKFCKDNLYNFMRSVKFETDRNFVYNLLKILLDNFNDKDNTLNVTSVLTDLYKDYQFGKFTEPKKINFMLDIGLNNMYSFDYGVKGGSINYASEKIGVQFILNDFKNKHRDPNTKSMGENYKTPQKVPVISNWYFFIYTSGILYNVVDVKTKQNFTEPIYGAGFGVSFFNKLKLNLSGTYNYDFGLNLGIDIPLFEYLNAK